MNKKYIIYIAIVAMACIMAAVLRTRTKRGLVADVAAPAQSLASAKSGQVLGEKTPRKALAEPLKVRAKYSDRAKDLLGQSDLDLPALRGLLRDWVRDDPIGCMSYLESLGDHPLRETLSTEAMRVWAAEDLFSAEKYAQKKILGNESDSRYYLAPVLDAIYAQAGFSAATDFLGVFPQTDQVLGSLSLVYIKYVDQDWQAARAYAQGLPNGRVKNAFLEINGASAARRAGTQILDAVSQNNALLSAEEKTGAIAFLLRTNQDKVAEWLLRQPKLVELDMGRIRAVSALSRTTPDIAVSVAEMISNDTMREKAIQEALQAWAIKNMADAVNWMVASDLTAEQCAQILVSVSSRTTNDRFLQMITNPNIQTAELERNQFVVLSAWARVDPQAASAWLKGSTLSQEKKQQFQSVIGSRP